MTADSEISLSIITPAFNSESFIERCLKNVIDQNVADVEHIIMDGLSSDRTAEIVRQYAAQHPHIRLFSEKDSGQSDAMNKGILKARGRFITFLNVDDYFEPDALQTVMPQIAQLSDRHLLVGNCNIVDIHRNLQSVRKPARCGYPEILKIWRRDVFPSNPASYFYARHLHELAGMYDVDEHYVLDYEMMIRLLKVGEVKYIDQTLGNFVLHEDTKTFVNSGGGTKITKLAVFNRYKKELPALKRWLLQLQFYYHLRLRRSNHPAIFFALRPVYALKRIQQKMNL